MAARVRSTNIAHPAPEPNGKGYRTGIDKRPVDELRVVEPGPSYGDGSGVEGDHVGDAAHHGGAQKAVYAFSREQLDWWAGELGRELPDGMFGENLTTEGIDLESLLVNQSLRIGDEVVLQVSVSRQPCATFQARMGERGWVKRFTAHGRCGAYFRVVTPGLVRRGDAIEVLDDPGHDIDLRTAFAAAMGDDEAARRVVAAQCLPPMYHERLVARLG